MILEIQNFKCFQNITIPINQLTIFAGGNGNGKSTIIQALLLLRRTIESRSKTIELNGVYCLNLGNSANLLYAASEISMRLSNREKNFSIRYDTYIGNELYITPTILEDSYRDNPLSYKEFYYLNAERVGPRISQALSAFSFPNTGFQGEYTAQIIKELDSRKFEVEENRIFIELNYGSNFFQRVNSWLSYILEGTTIEAYIDERTYTARIEVTNAFGKSTFPTNTGFGISYALPIIVTCLLAEKNRLVIIENPEAHLHPAAQSKLGYFLAKMANTGLQIVIETHSDHIINGIQIAVAKKDMTHKGITINYFDKGEEEPSVHSIAMNEKGELSAWPKGFFDQTQIDFSELIKLRRNV